MRYFPGDTMLKKNEYWILTAPAAIGLVLALTNMAIVGQNRQARDEVNARAQYIQQSAQLEPLYREIVKALADLSVRNNDVQLRELLAKQGITVSANPAPAASAPLGGAPATEPKKAGK